MIRRRIFQNMEPPMTSIKGFVVQPKTRKMLYLLHLGKLLNQLIVTGSEKTHIGFFIAVFSVVVALVYFVLKIIYWDTFVMGTAPILIGMFFLGAVQLLFLGLIERRPPPKASGTSSFL